MLGVVFGHDVHAVTAVLTAFMSGLALGSLLLARRSRRLVAPLRSYGWLEIGIGVACAPVPWLLDAVAGLPAVPVPGGSLGAGGPDLLRFALVVPVLLVPTTAMGATLPVLAQGLAAVRPEAGRAAGALYALNTAGAVLGVTAAGYGLLPGLGNRRTALLAAAANLAVGAAALWWSARRPGAVAAAIPAGPALAPVPGAVAPPAARRLVTVVLAVSGAVSMVAEVAWTRALVLVVGSSTYAFTAMLVAFLAGIAGGAAAYGRLAGGRPASAATLGALLAGAGGATAATIACFERLPELVVPALGWSQAPGWVQLLQLGVSAGALLPSTLLVGATLPCAVAVVTGDPRRIGEDVGRLYGANTLGAIGGAALGGLLLVPGLGVQRSLVLGAAAQLLLAALCWLGPGPAAPGRCRAAAAACGAAAAGVLLLPRWDLGVMSSGPAVYARLYLQTGQPVRAVLREREVLFYRDGPSGTVSVHRTGEHLFLKVNGKTDASTRGDMLTQVLSGHLPMLAHAGPRRVLVVGLGSGVTVAAVARHPVERIDVVEIEPAVVEASRFFAAVNRDVLADPRVRVLVADGRRVLAGAGERYDVIVSEPSNPWIAGMARLFTAEFFALARARLAPGGLMLQWLQTYSLEPGDLRMVLRTFTGAFPHASVWNMGVDLLLLGQLDEVPLDPGRFEERVRRIAGVREDLAAVGLRGWAAPFGLFLIGGEDLRQAAAGAPLDTDDRLALEFSAPRALYLDTGAANRALLRARRRAELPALAPAGRPLLETADARAVMGRASIAGGDLEQAVEHLERARRTEPEHVEAAVGLSVVALNRGHPEEALGLARQALARAPGHVDALFAAAVASDRLGRTGEAATLLERAARLAPDNREVQGLLRHVRARLPARRRRRALVPGARAA
jgi:spermidine synthase